MILLTGATGLVGHTLLARRAARGQKTRALIRATSHIPAELEHSEHIEWIRGNAADVNFLSQALQGVDKVVHAAGMVSFQAKDRQAMDVANTQFTSDMVNAAMEAKVKRFIYLSTVATLKTIDYKVATEEDTLSAEESEKVSYYARTKYEAELEVWRGIAEGLPAMMVCPSFVLGYAADFRSTADYFRSFLKKQCFYTDGEMGWVDVEDVVSLIECALTSTITGEKIIASGENATYKKVNNFITQYFWHKDAMHLSKAGAQAVMLAERVTTLFGGKRALSPEVLTFAFSHYLFDNAKSLRIFPEFRYTPLEDTLRRICAKYKKQ